MATLALREGSRDVARSSRAGGALPPAETAAERRDLGELLSETRLLLPGTEVFLAFLMTLPFTQRFDRLGETERAAYLCTFFCALLSFACFMAPAAYHRIARPIRHKERFKLFANVLIVIGLAPVSLSVILVGFLVTSVVAGRPWGLLAATVMAIVVTALWWIVPLMRLHDRFFPSANDEAEQAPDDPTAGATDTR
jgi:hypothetical protein